MQRLLYVFFISYLFITPGASGGNPEVLSCPKAAQAFKEKKYEIAYAQATPRCPTLKELARWKQLRYARGDVTFEDYQHFIKTHAHFPWMGDIRQSAELFLTPEVPVQKIAAWFKDFDPKSFKALEIYLEALKALKQMALYTKVMRQAWHTMSLTRAQENKMMRLGGGLIMPKDHLKRLETLLSKKTYKGVERQLARCESSLQPFLRTRVAFAQGDKKAIHLYNRLTRVEQHHPDMLYDYLSYLQRQESPHVLSFIQKHQGIFEKIPQQFWRLRYIAARDALITKQYEDVFKALKGHGLTKGHAYMQTQFLLGFVALRFLNDPDRALSHFQPAYKHLSEAGSFSRFAYWISQAYKKQGKREKAKVWLAKAKVYPQTFYGQEAFIKQGEKIQPSFLSLHYTDQERNVVLENSYFKYVILLKEVGAADDISPFLYKVYYGLKGNGEKRAFLAFCHKELPAYLYDMARLAGVIYNYKETYPIVPKTRAFQNVAMLNAIIRQESGFNPAAISGAGARGLMQIMPKTAQSIGAQMGHSIVASDLTEKPNLNVILGEAFFREKLAHFKGHKELTLAAYNAGPSNSQKWIKRYGDPRTSEIDLLTWIELIPYSETRSYVRRVVANYRIYQKLLESISE